MKARLSKPQGMTGSRHCLSFCRRAKSLIGLRPLIGFRHLHRPCVKGNNIHVVGN